ncbi:hypothetical protein [Acerihabitans sp.]|uniref:hypothetical protein n=1 Tax=Acerihabitans sp. TaxID=2811394 RepID=UPI002ED7E195
MNPFKNSLPACAGYPHAQPDFAPQVTPQAQNPPTSRCAPRVLSRAPYNASQLSMKRKADTAGENGGHGVPSKIRGVEMPGAPIPAADASRGSLPRGALDEHFIPFCETITALRRDVDALQREMRDVGLAEMAAAQLNTLPHFDRLMDVLHRYIEWMRKCNAVSQSLSAQQIDNLYENLSTLGLDINAMIQVITRIDAIYTGNIKP